MFLLWKKILYGDNWETEGPNREISKEYLKKKTFRVGSKK